MRNFRKISCTLLCILLFSCGKYAIPTEPGPPGEKGETGAAGQSCVTQSVPGGVQVLCPGSEPITILNGSNGADGQTITGPQGLPGQNAAPCVLSAVLGGVQIACPGSPAQIVLNGQNGSDGHNGTNGTAPTAVQFCPNAGPTSYPSNFPEFGLCLQNQLFAVYWDSHNAWLAQVPPGYYVSTSTSAPCNFTVALNCSITEN